MDLELARKKRDRRLRRRLLSALKMSLSMSPRGGLSGPVLMDATDSMTPGTGYEDERHCLELCRSLTAKGLIEEELIQRRRGQGFGLDYVFFKITAKGLSLQEESSPPDPDIDDERITE
jgi:hypothetical protein